MKTGSVIVDLAGESGAALRLVGDPRQLGAVGRGGVMETASRWTMLPSKARESLSLPATRCAK